MAATGVDRGRGYLPLFNAGGSVREHNGQRLMLKGALDDAADVFSAGQLRTLSGGIELLQQGGLEADRDLLLVRGRGECHAGLAATPRTLRHIQPLQSPAAR